MEIKNWLKNIKMSMIENKCGRSGHRILTQEGINGIN